jgi:hypothetical protein
LLLFLVVASDTHKLPTVFNRAVMVPVEYLGKTLRRLPCYITVGGNGVFIERCIIMEGVGVCDITREIAEIT